MNILQKVSNALFGKKTGDPTAQTVTVHPQSEGWEILGNMGGSNASQAMRVAAVYACVRLLAGGLSMLPIYQYRITDKGRKRVYGSDLERLLNLEPAPMYSAAAHWEGVMADILLRGDAFTYINRTRTGKVLELVPLDWGSVSIRRDYSVWPNRLKYYICDGMRTWGCDSDDMLHFPGFGFDGERSMSVLAYAACNAVKNASAMDKFAGSFFERGANPSIVLTTEKAMSEDLIEKTRQEFVKRYSGVENMNAHPLVLTEGLKAEKLTISAADAQLIEARQFQVVDIARAFGVPPHMIGETSASTSWGSGIESMNRAFVTFSLNPHLKRIEQELNRKLIGKNQFFEVDREALMVGDSKAQSDYMKAMLGGPGSGPGIMTVNEVRRMKNLPPINGLADQLYDPRIQPNQSSKNENLRTSEKDSKGSGA